VVFLRPKMPRDLDLLRALGEEFLVDGLARSSSSSESYFSLWILKEAGSVTVVKGPS
jgi:hypothetical protein